MASEKIERVVRLIVTEGLNQNEATSKVNITPQYFSAWKKKNLDEYQEIKIRYEREMLGDLPSLAIRTYKDILKHGNSEHVKYLVSQDILDRTGHKPADKIEAEFKGFEIVIGDD